jgi:hypothetical protein
MQKRLIRSDKNIISFSIKFLLIMCVFIFCDVNNLLSQVDTHFPVKVGNTWTYNEIVDIYLYGKQTITTVDTIDIEGKRYFLFDQFFYAREFKDSSLFRFEGQKVIRYVGGVEQVWFDFDAAVNDFWFLEIFDSDLDTTVQVKVTLISKNTDLTINGRTFNDCYGFYFRNLYATEHDWAYSLAKEIGCVEMWKGGSVQDYYKFREGTINGVEYADLVSKINEKQENNINIKNGSKILSVYPNPFNSSIRFELFINNNNKKDVFACIYNTLGIVIKTLPIDHIHDGAVAYDWQADNNRGAKVSSGIYFIILMEGGEVIVYIILKRDHISLEKYTTFYKFL